MRDFVPRLALAAWLVTSGGCVGGRSLGGSGGASPGGTSGGAGGEASVSDGGAGATGCNTLHRISLVSQRVDVLVLMDRAASMGDGDTWAQASAAVEALVAQNPAIDWGLALFGSDDACGVWAGMAVRVAPDNLSAITAVLAATTLGGEAPTGGAANRAATDLQMLGDSHPKFILLVSNGQSSCAPEPGTVDTLAATGIAAALQAGVPTFVLGLPSSSDPATVETLQQMAASGGRAQTGSDHAYYTPDEIASVFQTVVAATSCVLNLPDPPLGLTDVAVSLTLNDGRMVAVPHDAVNGWTYSDAGRAAIVFSGTSCVQLTDGSAGAISVAYACTDPPVDLGPR